MINNEDPDVAFARRLQQEELGGMNRNRLASLVQNDELGERLLNRGPGGQGQGAAIRDVRNENPTVEVIKCCTFLAEMIATAIVVSVTWRKGRENDQCNRIRNWLIVFSSRLLFWLPISILTFRKRQRNEPTTQIDKIHSWIHILTFLWFIIGQSWIYSGDCTEAKGLWIYALVLIILVYVYLALPIVFMLSCCLCLPCVFVVIRILRKPRNASEAAVRNLETRIFEAPKPPEGDDLEAGQAEELESCVICMEEYKEGEEIKLLPCGHEYHTECVSKWLREHNRNCPTCRHDITMPFPPPPRDPAAPT